MTAALLYASTTAADLGQTALDEKLPELRRYAAARGWSIAGEFTDSVPTGTGRRHGFSELCAAIGAGKGEVVLANSLSDLCWDLATGLRRLQEMGLGDRCALVCIRNSFDGTSAAGQLRLLDAMAIVEEHRRNRNRDRAMIGVLRAAAKTAGVAIAGRPRVNLNPMELGSMYARGLSQREMLALLARAGASVSKGTLSKAIKLYRDDGKFDEVARAAALEARGGLSRGGRKTKKKAADE